MCFLWLIVKTFHKKQILKYTSYQDDNTRKCKKCKFVTGHILLPYKVCATEKALSNTSVWKTK